MTRAVNGLVREATHSARAERRPVVVGLGGVIRAGRGSWPGVSVTGKPANTSVARCSNSPRSKRYVFGAPPRPSTRPRVTGSGFGLNESYCLSWAWSVCSAFLSAALKALCTSWVETVTSRAVRVTNSFWAGVRSAGGVPCATRASSGNRANFLAKTFSR